MLSAQRYVGMSPNPAAEFLLMPLNHLLQPSQLVLFPILLAISRLDSHGLCHALRTECCAVKCQMQWEVTMGLPGDKPGDKPGEGCAAIETLTFFAVITARNTRERQPCVFLLMP